MVYDTIGVLYKVFDIYSKDYKGLDIKKCWVLWRSEKQLNKRVNQWR